MKSINIRSFLFGGLVVLAIIALSSGTSDDADHLQFVPSPAGLGIFNKQSKTLYMYKMWNASLNTTPAQVFQISEDGSKLIDVK